MITILDPIHEKPWEFNCSWAFRQHEKSWLRALKKDPCAYCGFPQPKSAKEQRTLPGQRKATIDHIVPKSRIPKKGNCGWSWVESNKTAACYTCNHLKGDRSLLDFLLEENRPKDKACTRLS